MNDELNIGECPYCHGTVDQFGPVYQCRSCHAYGLSLEGLQEYTGHTEVPSNWPLPGKRGATP